MAEFLKANPSIKKEDIPTDLLTASGSGLEPYISPAAAAVQIPALVETTGLSKEQLESIVKAHTRGKILGVFGAAFLAARDFLLQLSSSRRETDRNSFHVIEPCQ